MSKLITTQGEKRREDLGIILPHEHVFVDLRTPDQPGHGEAESVEVTRLMKPELQKAEKAGITAIVECTPVGAGRRADILKEVSDAAAFPLVVPTGVYREPWVPQWVYEANEGVLEEWMTRELMDQIENSGVQAAWIKLSAGDNGLTSCETKILRAAARSGAVSNAVIGSHTIKGRVVKEQLDIVEKAGYLPERFIWIHTQCEPDINLHFEIARRGVWLEYDGIGGGESDEFYIERILTMLEKGFENQILLSQDRGWFDPAQPGGGSPKSFTYLIDIFIPKLRAAGVDEEIIQKLVCENPFLAFSR